MKPTEKQIEEIVGDLDAGMTCYFNLKTGEIRTIINFDSYIGADEEPWEEDLREIDEHRDDYLAFEGLNRTNHSGSWKILQRPLRIRN